MKKLLFSFLLLVFLTVANCDGDKDSKSKGPIVSTPFGDIEGFEYTTHNNVDVNVFLGIRYAEAPDHIFRFEKPRIVEKWNGLVHHAKRYKAACIPYHRNTLQAENYSEDCLFVNIMTPKNMNVEKKYPVMVFVHGGGYQVGDTESLGYKNASENFVSNDIVVVTVQYRLGPLGFFTTGDSINPGNLGLWDLTMSLQFLHQVLPSFGGDIDRVTLAGHSAGSSAVSALMYSPHADHYFHQAIELSGSVFCEFSMSDSVVEESKALAQAVGCKMTDPLQIRECMKERTMDEILDGVDKIGSSRRHANFLKFHPRFDNDFFPFNSDDMVRKAPKKKTIQGVTSLESGLFVFVPGLETIADVNIEKSRYHNYTRDEFMEFITTGVVTEKEYGRKMGPFLHLLTEFYVNDFDEDIERDSMFYIEKYTDLLSDLQFFIPSAYEIDLKRLNKWKDNYFYVFDYDSDTQSFGSPVKGALHAAEMRFLFQSWDFHMIPLSENDKVVQRTILESFTNFIKTGNPSTSKVNWPAVNDEHPFQHLRINEKPSIQESFRAEAIKLWLETVPKVIGTDILKRTRLPGSHARNRHTEL